jgi:hypothetical protein
MRISEKSEPPRAAWVAAAIGSCALAVSWAGIQYLVIHDRNDVRGTVNNHYLFFFFVLAPLFAVALILIAYISLRWAGSSTTSRVNASTCLAASLGACSAAVVLYATVTITLAAEKYSSTNALQLWQFDAGIVLGALALIVVTTLASRLSGAWLRGALAANLVAFTIACFFAYRLINWFVFEYYVGS